MSTEIGELTRALEKAMPKIKESISWQKYVDDTTSKYTLNTIFNIVAIEDIHSSLAVLIQIIEPDWIHAEDKVTDIVNMTAYISINQDLISKSLKQNDMPLITQNVYRIINSIEKLLE